MCGIAFHTSISFGDKYWMFNYSFTLAVWGDLTVLHKTLFPNVPLQKTVAL